MTLTKADIIKDIHENCGLSKTQSAEVAETIFEIIKPTLDSIEPVVAGGFGRIVVKGHKPRRGKKL